MKIFFLFFGLLLMLGSCERNSTLISLEESNAEDFKKHLELKNHNVSVGLARCECRGQAYFPASYELSAFD